jgi:tetratricopeptide (TPR) repeat protein
MRQRGLAVALAAGFCFLGALRACAQDAAATPTPADTADILALLDQEKPDPAKAAKLAADADAAIPANLTAPKRGDAYFNRARARALVGRINDAIADAQEAVKLSKGENYDRVTSRYEQFLHRRLLEVGDSKHAVPIMMGEIRNFQGRQPGRLFSLYDELAIIYLLADNVDETERLAGTLHSLLAASRTWSAGYDPFRAIFQAEVAESICRGGSHLPSCGRRDARRARPL